MTVKEMIEKLQKVENQEAELTVWNCFHDCETNEIFVNQNKDGSYLIINANFGKTL